MGQALPAPVVPQFPVAQAGFQSLPISLAAGISQPLLPLAAPAAAAAVPAGASGVPGQLLQPGAQLPSQVLLQPPVQAVGLPVSIGQAAEASLPAADALYQVLLQASRPLLHIFARSSKVPDLSRVPWPAHFSYKSHSATRRDSGVW